MAWSSAWKRRSNVEESFSPATATNIATSLPPGLPLLGPPHVFFLPCSCALPFCRPVSFFFPRSPPSPLPCRSETCARRDHAPTGGWPC